MGNDITKSPYAEFLEMLCKNIMELKPDKIAVVALMQDGSAFTSSYGDCGPYDLAMMGIHMQADAMMEIVTANAKDIVAAAQEGDEEDES